MRPLSFQHQWKCMCFSRTFQLEKKVTEYLLCRDLLSTCCRTVCDLLLLVLNYVSKLDVAWSFPKKVVILMKTLLAFLARWSLLITGSLNPVLCSVCRQDWCIDCFFPKRENSRAWSLPWTQPLLETSTNCLGIGMISLSAIYSVCWIPVTDAKYLNPPQKKKYFEFIFNKPNFFWCMAVSHFFPFSPSSHTSCHLRCCTTMLYLLIKDEFFSNKEKRMFSQWKAVYL